MEISQILIPYRSTPITKSICCPSHQVTQENYQLVMIDTTSPEGVQRLEQAVEKQKAWLQGLTFVELSGIPPKYNLLAMIPHEALTTSNEAINTSTIAHIMKFGEFMIDGKMMASPILAVVATETKGRFRLYALKEDAQQLILVGVHLATTNIPSYILEQDGTLPRIGCNTKAASEVTTPQREPRRREPPFTTTKPLSSVCHSSIAGASIAYDAEELSQQHQGGKITQLETELREVKDAKAKANEIVGQLEGELRHEKEARARAEESARQSQKLPSKSSGEKAADEQLKIMEQRLKEEEQGRAKAETEAKEANDAMGKLWKQVREKDTQVVDMAEKRLQQEDTSTKLAVELQRAQEKITCLEGEISRMDTGNRSDETRNKGICGRYMHKNNRNELERDPIGGRSKECN